MRILNNQQKLRQRQYILDFLEALLANPDSLEHLPEGYHSHSGGKRLLVAEMGDDGVVTYHDIHIEALL